jgi:23S rRNA (cytidine1920-2'-O)/16S rRNA (cytidine1409-2'-O)-methyltransferase
MVLHKKEPKQRLDGALVERGLASSREEASRFILAGAVRVDGIRIDKRAKLIEAHANIELVGGASPFVSRSGGKLAAALETFHIACEGLVAMDVGASTGGFTDCLLQRGISKVYAVDVGYGQLDWNIRQDSRVVVLERFNIRYLPREKVSEPIQVAVIDVSFISLNLVLPCVVPFLADQAVLVALVKPQFEVGKGKVGAGGIVRDEGQRQEVINQIIRCAEGLGFQKVGVMDSPILGKKGNREAVLALKWSEQKEHL